MQLMSQDADWMSNVPMFQFSNFQMFQYSIGPLVYWSIGPLVYWSISLFDHLTIGPLVQWSIGPLSLGPLVHWSIGPLVYWTNGPLNHWSIGPLVECKMVNVNKVKLLSERTSGVPPVIFSFRSEPWPNEGICKAFACSRHGHLCK